MPAQVGIRALKQNASAVVAAVAAGESLTITDRGRPVARLVPLQESQVERLIASGQARLPRSPLVDLAAPNVVVDLSAALRADRDGARY